MGHRANTALFSNSIIFSDVNLEDESAGRNLGGYRTRKYLRDSSLFDHSTREELRRTSLLYVICVPSNKTSDFIRDKAIGYRQHFAISSL